MYDGQCAIHLDYEEMRNDLGKEIFNLVHARLKDPKTVESLSDVIMNDVVGPHLEHMAARHIGYREENKAWAKRVDRRSSWARNLVQRFIDMRREKENAEAEAEALRKSRVLDHLIVERQRKRLIDGARERAKLVAERAFAREAETRLRSDFGELAKDLKQVARHLAPAVGGDQHPVHGRWIMELHSWRATAEILADKELSDNLDEVRKAPIEDFGPVPRPEWRCHLHPNAEPMQRLNGTKICSDGMCIQAEGD
jgi:hypothetical protein